VVSSANPSAFGQSVTFTATISANAPGAGIPTGTVTFEDGSTILGTGTLNGFGIATYSTSALAIGGHSITADYGGDVDFTSSDSSAVNQTVDQDATTSALVSSANPSVFGQSVTFTATITADAPGSGTPTGTVTFEDGSTILGTGTLNVSGIASFTTSSLSVGGHSITAIYGGDVDFISSTSSAVNQTVDQDATTSALVSSANPSDFGQSVTFTATVSADAPGAGIPTGTVTFEDGSTILGTGTLNVSGVATFTTSSLSVGGHSITADYGGDVDFDSSASLSLSQVVDENASTSAIVSSTNPSVWGQPVTFAATVTVQAPGSGTPTGSVTFEDGSTILGTATLNGSGIATFSTSSLSVGSHSITAVYGGDTDFDFAPSTSSTLSQTVNQDATTSAVVSSANPSVFGQLATFTATISADSPGFGTPTGSVTFSDGSTTLGTATLDGSGIATFSTSSLSVGSHSITAVYGGDTDFTSSTSSAVNQTVDQDVTTTSIASSANPSVFGQSVTLTATITANSPGSGIPTGTVTFADGSTILGTATLDGSGIATYSTSSLSVGSHSITAVYGGDTDFTSSTSSTLSQTVNQDATASVVVSSANPSSLTQSITFTVTVTANAPGSGIPSGSVTFYDGSTILGDGSLDDSGVATLSTSDLAMGDHSITAVYNGSPQYLVSTSLAWTQTVNAPVATKLTISDQPVTLNAGATGGTLVVDITNNSGTIDPAFSSAVAISILSGPAGAKLGGTLTAMASNGVASFSDLRITQEGTYVLEISASGFTAETAPITINAGPPSQLGVVAKPGASWQFGPISPAVVVGVTDQFGNLVTAGNPNVTAAIAFGPMGAVLYGTRTVRATNGYATFSDLSLNLPGMYGLAFSSGSNSPTVIEDLDIVGIPAQRYLFNGSPLSGTGILAQQQNNAPFTINYSLPTATGLPQVTVLSGPSETAAANFSNEPLTGELFGAGDAPQAAANSLLEPDADSLWNFLQST
jgi:hypothetical protein